MPIHRSTPKFLSAVALLFVTATVHAQTSVTSPKITITNASNTEIPLELGSTVEVLANGDLSVRCRLDAESKCPAIGSGGDSGSGEAPPTVTLTPSALTLTAGTSNFTLTWSSSGDACVAIGPSTVANWNGRALAPSGSQLLSLAEGTYEFGLRCYSEGGNLQRSTAAITVNAPVIGEPTGVYCTEYYGPGGQFPTPTEPNFTAFNFERIERTFQQIFEVEPGMGSGRVGLPGTYVNPATGRYLAIPFQLSSSNAASQIKLSWAEAQAIGITTGSVIVTISPCPGDFRARAGLSPTDHFLSTQCRSALGINGNLTIAVAGSGLSGCAIPRDKTLYINIANSNMYQTTAPANSTCQDQSHCGVSMLNL